VLSARCIGARRQGYAAELREKRKEPRKFRVAAEKAAADADSARRALAAQRSAERTLIETNVLHGIQSDSRKEFHRHARVRRTNGIAGRTSHTGKSYAPVITGRNIRSDCDRNACTRRPRVLRSSFAPPSKPPKLSVSHVGSCGTCGQSASQRCGGCHSVMYCSTTCQKAGWQRHKSGCCLSPLPEHAAQSNVTGHVSVRNVVEVATCSGNCRPWSVFFQTGTTVSAIMSCMLFLPLVVRISLVGCACCSASIHASLHCTCC
jgi:hypothetical protein